MTVKLVIIRPIPMHAVHEGFLNMNPCAGLFVKVAPIEQKVLNKNEVEILLREGKDSNHPFYPVWVFSLETGMRSGEMFCLLWTDIDFESCLIFVDKSWNNKNGVKSTKSGKSRVIPISDDLLLFLKELKLQSTPDSAYVLPRLTEWARGEQARVLKAFCKSSGITLVRFHDLRATFITNLLAQGVSLARVMAVVGHTQIDTTNIYLRKAGIDLKGVTNELGYSIPSYQKAQVLKLVDFRDAPHE